MSELIRIDDLNDARLNPYRHLKDRDLAQEGDRFIAESEQVVRRLIASGLGIDSILVAEKRIERFNAAIPQGVATYVLSDALIEQTIGFHFHSGVLACGIRPANVELQHFLASLPPQALMMFLPDTNNTENLGVLMRIAAGFGVAGLVLGPRCCDPFYRQAVRVSMGTVFSLKLIRVADNVAAIDRLQAAGVECVATVLDPSAERLTSTNRAARTALLFGNESSGLAADVVAACHRRATIPMDLGTDSLNVAVAAGIVMHHFGRVAESASMSERSSPKTEQSR